MHTRELPFSAPYDWENVLAYFRSHQLPFVEAVDDSGYERVVSTRHGLGWFRVEKRSGRKVVSLTVWNGTDEDVSEISASARKMFDLDADPHILRKAMGGDGSLSSLWAGHPGLRLARSWSASEAMFAAVLGQVVSVKFGRLLVRELMQAAGSATKHPKTSEQVWLFPTARQILGANLSSVRTSEKRRTTIRLLAQAIEDGTFNPSVVEDHRSLRRALRSVPGVGAWTAEYVAMRGFGDNDAFPATDYGLKQELIRNPKMNIDSVRPWRGYAAIALWKRYAEAKRVSAEVVV